MHVQDTVLYRAVGEDDALQYFFVDTFSGTVTIKKSLYPGSRTQYSVLTPSHLAHTKTHSIHCCH